MLLITGDPLVATAPDDGPEGGPVLRKPFTRSDLLAAVASTGAAPPRITVAPDPQIGPVPAQGSSAQATLALGLPDDIPHALHELNNALTAALGRIEICEDTIEQIDRAVGGVMKECLQAASHALIRASGRAARIAELIHTAPS